MAQLGKILGLSKLPIRIEGYDISISAVLFRWALGKLLQGADPSGYRRFRIKSVAQQDDFACMAEVVNVGTQD